MISELSKIYYITAEFDAKITEKAESYVRITKNGAKLKSNVENYRN